MARRIKPQAVEVAGIRGALIDSVQASFDRLVGADNEVADFSVERDRLAGMVADLRAGRDVSVHVGQIPRELRPATGKVFTVTGNALVAQEYEKLS
jgi:hypothetical protein